MLIKHKLGLNTGMLVVSMMFMLGLLSFAITSLEDNIELARNVDAVESSVLQLRRHEKDFLARKDLKYHDKFNKQIASLKQNISTLEFSFDRIGTKVSEISSLKNIIDEYKAIFDEIITSQKAIGLHPKDGLYGNLRGAVHDVEELIGKDDYKLLSGMLQLRRNEKDFMLRLDEKYITRLSNNTDTLIDEVQSSNLEADRRNQIVDLLANYKSSFLALVAEQQNLGLSHDTGLQGQLRETVHKVESIQSNLVKASLNGIKERTMFIDIVAYSAFFVILAVALAFAWYLMKGLLTSISRMQDSMMKIAETNDLTVEVHDNEKDELSDMANVFNRMVSSFRNLIIEVNHSVDTLNDATQSVAENISTTTAGVDSQIQETDMVATAVTEMVATVDEIANNTHEAAKKAELTNENAENGKSGVNKTISQIEVLSEKLLASENVVQELAKDSETIGSVLDVIRGIAEQTNLLALNAAIEAARAGEQGRGFAVVADEVRTLASRTQDSTQEIEGIISSLQSRTKEIVEHMATCRTQGEDSSSQASTAGALLEEITHDVATIMDMNTAIATAIQEQSAVASEVNEHVVSIRDVAEQSGKMAHQNAQMSEELSQQAEVLRNEVSLFKV